MKSFSSLGFGCYRIDNRYVEHSEALTHALVSGINLIDTSANYSDGRSELLIGNVFDDLFDENKINRDDLTIVTKVGYIQGQNYKTALKRDESGKPFPEVVKYADGLWHCIHPEFLEDQLSHQLTRLNLNFIDVYLLHNPEYFLMDALKREVEQSEAQQEYYRRIRKAFEFLEQKVQDGVIGAYGISSNTFPSSIHKYNFTSLESVHEIASQISFESNFKFIQLPFNLIETGALRTKNQLGESVSAIEFAAANNIKVLVNRPFNTISSKGLVRTVDHQIGEFIEKDFFAGLKQCLVLEQELTGDLNEVITEDQKDVLKNFIIAKEIDKNWKHFGSIENFNDMLEHYFSLRLNAMYDFMETTVTESGIKEKFDTYISFVNVTLNLLGNYYRINNLARNKFFHSTLDKYLPEEYHNLTLSQKTLLILRSVKGVDCVLVGARRNAYVDDIVKVADLPLLENADRILHELHTDMINAEYHSADL